MPKLTKPSLCALALLVAAVAPAGAQTGAPPPSPTPADSVTAPAQKAVYRDGQKERFQLDGTWFYRADAADQGLRGHFERQTSLTGWSPVTIPNAFNATDISDASDRGSIGWYRKDFKLPGGAPKGSSYILRFESVNYRATVFLNGRQIGTHEGAFIPFELAGKGVHGGENRLVVRVDSRRRSTDLPPAQDQANGRPGGGWWNYGGILREVYLRRVRGVDIRALLARPILPCASCDAKVLVRATLANPAGRKKRVTVRATVGPARARFHSVVVPPGKTRTVQAYASVRNPHLWQPGDPHLYAVHVTAAFSRRVASQYDTHIGIRSIKVKNGRMLLNGRPVQLRGASMHEDSPDNGFALTPQQLEANMALLRELGATVTRAHYPLHPYTLEMCDRMGIMVWEQVPFNRGRFGNSATSTESADDTVARSRAVREKALGYVRGAIARDQNHPSVYAWSVANEPDPRPGRSERSYFGKALKIVHRLDPSRLAAVDLAGYPTVPESDDYAQFDAIGLNSYFGWYPGPGGSLDDRTGLRPFLRLMHDYYPHSALFVTEFGAEANRDGPIDEKGTYEFQQDLLDYHLDAYDEDKYINGAIVWILKDFRVQPGWDGGNPKPSPPVLKKGLVDEFGNKKPAFFDLATRFRNTPPLK
jgi:beta-glucuronidase